MRVRVRVRVRVSERQRERERESEREREREREEEGGRERQGEGKRDRDRDRDFIRNRAAGFITQSTQPQHSQIHATALLHSRPYTNDQSGVRSYAGDTGARNGACVYWY